VQAVRCELVRRRLLDVRLKRILGNNRIVGNRLTDRIAAERPGSIAPFLPHGAPVLGLGMPIVPLVELAPLLPTAAR